MLARLQVFRKIPRGFVLATSYGVEISAALVSEITEDLDAKVRAWQTRATRCDYWNPNRVEPLAMFRGHEGGTLSVADSPTQYRIASGSDNGALRI
jgi:hypothetical protein